MDTSRSPGGFDCETARDGALSAVSGLAGAHLTKYVCAKPAPTKEILYKPGKHDGQ